MKFRLRVRLNVETIEVSLSLIKQEVKITKNWSSLGFGEEISVIEIKISALSGSLI